MLGQWGNHIGPCEQGKVDQEGQLAQVCSMKDFKDVMGAFEDATVAADASAKADKRGVERTRAGKLEEGGEEEDENSDIQNEEVDAKKAEEATDKMIQEVKGERSECGNILGAKR